MPMSRVIVVAAIVVLSAACGGGSGDHETVAAPTTTVPPPQRTTVAVTTVPSKPLTLVAQATGSQLAVFDAPGARSPARVLANPWFVDPNVKSTAVPQVFLAASAPADGW